MVQHEAMRFNAGIIYLCLLVLPSPLLALVLEIPTRSPDGKKVYYTWTSGDRDPKTITLQISCGGFMPFPPSTGQVSILQASTTDRYHLSMKTSPVDCKLNALSEGRNIAQSPPFRKLEVSGTLQTSTIAPPPAPSPSAPSPGPTPGDSVGPSTPKPSTTTPGTTPPAVQVPSTSATSSKFSSQAAAAASSAEGGSSVPHENRGKSSQGTSTTPQVSSSTSTSTTRGSDSETPHRTPPLGAIIGGVIGGLALVALLFGFLYYWRHRARSAPSTAYRTDNDNGDYGPIDDTRRQMERFRSEVKNHNIPDGGTRVTEEDIALRRKRDIMDDLRFEAAAREGVKADQIV
ncbi:hypothetical protein BDZ94DRAFT_1297058 [Collybia nuda]|uniref:Uncharacterized protein n=1 Tax=Collybia nuda TaxID=64659 RepID=A0A9P5YBA6_9AGAR|nr:hypothetical protein BDZ94DRAFT_1297058 [Collybia nuda]